MMWFSALALLLRLLLLLLRLFRVPFSPIGPVRETERNILLFGVPLLADANWDPGHIAIL